MHLFPIDNVPFLGLGVADGDVARVEVAVVVKVLVGIVEVPFDDDRAAHAELASHAVARDVFAVVVDELHVDVG